MTTKTVKDLPAAPVFMRTQFNYDHNAASKASGLACVQEGEDWTKATKAHQSFKEECDINEILRRFGKTPELMPVNALKGTYGDFSNVVDYHTALNQIIASEAQFDALPSNLRKRFDNDPAELLEFLQDPKNETEAIELGLVNAPKTEPKVQVIEPTVTPE
jgi:phage internal scaffolding protein